MKTTLDEKISGFIGAFIVALFVLGLAESISAGAAGFWGGLPFWVICFIAVSYTHLTLPTNREV